MSFKLKGQKKMAQKLKAIADKAPDKAAGALRMEAEMIMTDSKRNFVPVDLGTLRSSGKVDEPKRRGKTIEIEMSFGGAASPYAEAVHEHPSTASPPTWKGAVVTFSPAGRGPKYLEKPMRQAEKGMDKRLARTLGVTLV